MKVSFKFYNIISKQNDWINLRLLNWRKTVKDEINLPHETVNLQTKPIAIGSCLNYDICQLKFKLHAHISTLR